MSSEWNAFMFRNKSLLLSHTIEHVRNFGKELENRSFKGSDPTSIEHSFCSILCDNFTFDKGKRKLSYLHFSIRRLRITELTTLKMKTLTWWMSSVKITANLSAEDRELQDSSTGQQLRRLLMYWFVGLWNADNLCHTFISFLWLSLVPSAPGPPQQNNLSLLLSQVSINALCSRCHGATQTHQGY